jgi:peptidyl-prolyl cis-trans isomerase D
MAGTTDNRKLGYRIALGAVVMVLGGSMLLYLVPQSPGTGGVTSDTVAKVGDQEITVADVRRQLDEIGRSSQIPKQFEGFYAHRILDQLVFEKSLEYEAKHLGITVSDEERADRIRQVLPTAYEGGTFIGRDRYAAEIQARYQLSVPVFEDLVTRGLLQEKFTKLITDGISVGPAELQEEFRYRNEKVKLDYALIKPEDLESKINPDESEIKAAYEKNRAQYQIPERRVVRYGLVDVNQVRQSVHISDEQLKAQYQQNIQQYQVPNRVHVEHILLFTQNKTDAEVAEIKHKAEDVLKQAKKGAKFEDLAKKYSEDPGTKDKGGDLGWIVEKQTVPEFEKAAFSLSKDQISDLVQTKYGFHIIKLLDKETAHTKSFDEVKDSLRAPLVLSQADKEASNEADKISAEVRRSNKTSLDDLAREFHLTVSETRPVGQTEPLLELGNSQDIKDAIFRQRLGDVSLPIRTDRGYVILSLKDIRPAHQGSLDEVRDKVVADLKRLKASEQARVKSEELVKRVKAGEKFDVAAKTLGLDPKTSEPFARSGNIPGAASGKQLAAAFHMKPGDVGSPLSLGANWLVYRVAEKQEANPADFEKQKKDITTQLLESKRSLAFEAFKTSLEDRLQQEGKLKKIPENLKSFGNLGLG